jgi:hypothetical protein
MRTILLLLPLTLVALACRQMGIEPELLLKVAPREGKEGDASRLTTAERRGRDLWFKATAGSERWHTYGRPQRLALTMAWNELLSSERRGSRFARFGVVSDADCRAGGDDSYGWDLCPGDEGGDGLLAHVGREGWRDPACDLNENDVETPGNKRESSCALRFGTSAGVVGLRKFPNPRFRSDRWPGWESWDPRDAAVEPPFLIGMSCAACHAGFDPVKPPVDPERPRWDNVRGLVGNPFLRIGPLLAAGISREQPAAQILALARPGTLPGHGAVEPIMALSARPPFPEIIANKSNRIFEHEIKRWRRLDNCNGHVQALCQCVGQSCWTMASKTEPAFHLLKGGEDAAGADLAVQRAFVEMGSCAETCWLGRDSFDVAQCRRDCASWRAVEDRVGDLLAYMLTGRAPELAEALGLGPEELIASRQIGGRERWEQGRKLFARECAKCHSSQKPNLPGQKRDATFFEGVDFHRRNDAGLRVDWLGNDELTSVTEVGTNRCRALRATHTRGRLWEAFGSETYRARPKPDVPELATQQGGGRGYYRNVSLLGLWAQAPFFHNGALGPEAPTDPGVAARLAAFDRAVNQLLSPGWRDGTIRRTTSDVVVDLDARFWTGDPAKLGEATAAQMRSVQVRLPTGVPLVYLESLDEDALLDALQAEVAGEESLEKRWEKLQAVLERLYREESFRERILSLSAACRDLVEDKGHEYGATLSEEEKQTLIAFLKTL